MGRADISEVWRPVLDRSNDPRYNFYANPTVDELIAQQGKGPIDDPKILVGDFWPEDEAIPRGSP